MGSTDLRRGEIWLVSLGAASGGKPGKNRPAIVVSVDEIWAGVEDELFVVVPSSASRAVATSTAVSPAEGTDQQAPPSADPSGPSTRTRLLRRLGTASLKRRARSSVRWR
jgi:mRNA interferase MazF